MHTFGFQLQGAQPKQSRDDARASAPTQQPMRAGGEKIRRNPSTDQKKIRHQMARSAAVHTAFGQDLIPGKFYVTDRDGSITAGPHDTREQGRMLFALGPEFARIIQIGPNGERLRATGASDSPTMGDEAVLEEEGQDMDALVAARRAMFPGTAVTSELMRTHASLPKLAWTMEQLQARLDSGSFSTTIDGDAIDNFSAGTLMSVMKALNPENQAKMMSFNIQQAALVAFKLVNKSKSAGRLASLHVEANSFLSDMWDELDAGLRQIEDGDFNSADALIRGIGTFWPGDGAELSGALMSGGWSLNFIDGDYNWTATAPGGGTISYTEGDISKIGSKTAGLPWRHADWSTVQDYWYLVPADIPGGRHFVNVRAYMPGEAPGYAVRIMNADGGEYDADTLAAAESFGDLASAKAWVERYFGRYTGSKLAEHENFTQALDEAREKGGGTIVQGDNDEWFAQEGGGTPVGFVDDKGAWKPSGEVVGSRHQAAPRYEIRDTEMPGRGMRFNSLERAERELKAAIGPTGRFELVDRETGEVLGVSGGGGWAGFTGSRIANEMMGYGDEMPISDGTMTADTDSFANNPVARTAGESAQSEISRRLKNWVLGDPNCSHAHAVPSSNAIKPYECADCGYGMDEREMQEARGQQALFAQLRRRAGLVNRTAATVTYSPGAPSYFIADFDKIAEALRPWVRELDDGFQYIDPSAPPDLVRMHQSLIERGYANSYFASKTAAYNGEPTISREDYETKLRHDYAGPGTPLHPDADGYWAMYLGDGGTTLATGLSIEGSADINDHGVQGLPADETWLDNEDNFQVDAALRQIIKEQR